MGGGGSQKVTNDDEGEEGVTIPPKIDDVICEQPLTKHQHNKLEATLVRNAKPNKCNQCDHDTFMQADADDAQESCVPTWFLSGSPLADCICLLA